MNRDRCDVLIVGGGPAGSSCARALRQAGMDVLVLDKNNFPRDKVCAGWVTPPVFETLQISPVDYAREHVLQPITGFQLGLIGGRTLATDYPAVVSYGIRRCEFDHYLLQRTGARLALGETVTAISRSNDGWLINNRIETPLLIGAGGHFCPVARYLGADVGSREPAVTAREIEFQMSAAQQQQCRVAPHRPELYFCGDLQGYGWVFRKGDYLNVGLGRENPRRLTEHSANFIARLKSSGMIPVDIPDTLKGHAYLLYAHGRRKLYDDSVLLIGDAAGLAYAHSGEGIRPAVESGLLAAATVLAAEGNYAAAKLQPYRNRLTGRFGASTTENVRLVPDSVRRFIGLRLLGNRWLNRFVILDNWFLRSHQPLLEVAA